MDEPEETLKEKIKKKASKLFDKWKFSTTLKNVLGRRKFSSGSR